MFERAFSEFADREPSPASTWRAMVTRREGFAPEDLVLAVADGRIVGGAFLIDADEIWVDKLAVAREHRHRGIARALLQTAFARSFDRGYTWTSLDTDSRTGALSLYERVGMRIHRSFTGSPSSSRERWPRDSNPRGGHPPTRSPGVPLRPLGQATATSLPRALTPSWQR